MKLNETTPTAPPPPRTFSLELSDAELVLLGTLSYRGEQGGYSSAFFFSLPSDLRAWCQRTAKLVDRQSGQRKFPISMADVLAAK